MWSYINKIFFGYQEILFVWFLIGFVLQITPIKVIIFKWELWYWPSLIICSIFGANKISTIIYNKDILFDKKLNCVFLIKIYFISSLSKPLNHKSFKETYVWKDKPLCQFDFILLNFSIVWCQDKLVKISQILYSSIYSFSQNLWRSINLY